MNLGFTIHSIEVLEKVRVPVGKKAARGPYYRCKCHRCGNENYVATSGDINSGRIHSCGCLRNSEEHALINVTHGQRRQLKGTTTRAYKAWAEMKRRCNDRFRENYKWYGGRDISYDKSWEEFETFYADMGECSEGLELDRIDNEKGYCKANCRWVTHKENCQNRGAYNRDL